MSRPSRSLVSEMTDQPENSCRSGGGRRKLQGQEREREREMGSETMPLSYRDCHDIRERIGCSCNLGRWIGNVWQIRWFDRPWCVCDQRVCDQGGDRPEGV